MEIKDTKSSLDALKHRMDRFKKVFYVRFGDNDIANIMGFDYRGRDLRRGQALGGNKTIYSDKQSQNLKRSFCIEHPNYMRGLVGEYPIEEGMKQRVFKYSTKSLGFIDKSVKKLTDNREFYNPITFHYYFYKKPEEFLSFVEQYINPHKILFVGSCQNPDRLFNVNEQIHTVEKNAYSQKEEVMKQFKNQVWKHSLVIMAAGQLTRAIAHEAWMLPYNFHYIDIGSLVDVLDGKGSRGWIKCTDVMEDWKKRLNYV